MIRFVKLIVVLCVVISLIACNRSRLEPQSARVDKLFAEWTRNDAPGCAVGVSHNGAIVYEHGYGMANLERHVSNTPETVFPIASISKAFTAMSVCERGNCCGRDSDRSNGGFIGLLGAS
jgi:CubicO group peptidase (beta-lactamase class C family)